MAAAPNDGSNVATAKTAHVAELVPFIQPDFDPATYLNSVLPVLPAPITFRSSKQQTSALGDLTVQTQTLLSQLTAQTSRLCTTLSQLTNEILRSGTRLAYEVDILRGDTVGLSETLQTKLKTDISQFVADEPAPETRGEAELKTNRKSEPEALEQLRTLALVRTRLDTVVRLFGEAMEWPVAPSDLTSSFISVSAPGPSAEETRAREDKARAVQQGLREQITKLLQSATSVDRGAAAARQRIEQLRELTTVWKGTGEEKARAKVVDELEDIVDAEVAKNRAKTGRAESPSRTPKVGESPRKGAEGPTTRPVEGGYGFINNLRRLKGDIFLE